MGYSHEHVVGGGGAAAGPLQEVVDLPLDAPVAVVSVPGRLEVQRLAQQRHSGRLQPLTLVAAGTVLTENADTRAVRAGTSVNTERMPERGENLQSRN